MSFDKGFVDSTTHQVFAEKAVGPSIENFIKCWNVVAFDLVFTLTAESKKKILRQLGFSATDKSRRQMKIA